MYSRATKCLSIGALLILCACAKPTPIPSEAMLPDKAVYSQTHSGFFLRQKIAVGDFNYAGTNAEAGTIVYSNFGAAVSKALSEGNYLVSGSSAQYVLSGSIKEVAMPRCGYGSCEGGSTIEYTLTNKSTHRVAWDEMLVVPYTSEAPVFIGDQERPIIIRVAIEKTVGTNIAQLIQVLNRKTNSDLRE